MRPPLWSTYTVLDVEISAVGNQESDHLVTIQSHSIMQRGVSFLEKQSEQTEGGPEARKWLPRGYPAWGMIPSK